MDLVDQIDAILFDLGDGAFLMVIISLKWIII